MNNQKENEWRDKLKIIFNTEMLSVELEGLIEKTLSSSRKALLEEVVGTIEGMKLKNENSIDKLPETMTNAEANERNRITNLLNENMVFGYQQALYDITKLLTQKIKNE